MKNDYFPRILDELLNDYLEAFGATLIKGPKWCGKNNNRRKKSKKRFEDAGSRPFRFLY